MAKCQGVINWDPSMTPFDKTELIKAGAYDWYGLVKSIVLIIKDFEK